MPRRKRHLPQRAVYVVTDLETLPNFGCTSLLSVFHKETIKPSLSRQLQSHALGMLYVERIDDLHNQHVVAHEAG